MYHKYKRVRFVYTIHSLADSLCYFRANAYFCVPIKRKILKRLWQRLTNWELWPFYVIYTPLGFVWVYYAIKARAFWFFSPVNPTLEFAGFEGESKKEMYEQLPEDLYPKTIYIDHNTPEQQLAMDVRAANFEYPFIVKPQIGMQGMLFRKIDNFKELTEYHSHVPMDYVIQDMVDMPMEFSVFHIRYPDQQKGIVTGFILKEYLQVTGDGKHTLLQLILAHPKAKHRETEMRHKHPDKLETVIPAGEPFYLSIAGNHNRGARFINLHKEIDQQLCDVFDKISVAAGQFYFGRYDLKSTSIEDLKAGKNIMIMEYNGAGAEPNHIYDCNMSYGKALSVVADHWEHLYQIGKINNKKGVRYWSFWEGNRHLRKAAKFFKVLKRYDHAY
jgi:hypothetical protein